MCSGEFYPNEIITITTTCRAGLLHRGKMRAYIKMSQRMFPGVIEYSEGKGFLDSTFYITLTGTHQVCQDALKYLERMSP